jgi:hypothetical protein
MDFYAILSSPLGICLVGYGLLMIAIAIAIYPIRKNMFSLSEDLLKLKNLTESDKRKINLLLDSCMSFRIGVIVPIAIIGVISDRIVGVKPVTKSSSVLLDDQRYHKIIVMYFLSILAANPLVGLITVPLVFVSVLTDTLIGRTTVRESVEEPIIRASLSAA